MISRIFIDTHLHASQHFLPYPTFCRLLTDWAVYIRLFLSRRAHTYLYTLISAYKHLHYAFDLVQHKNYTYLNSITPNEVTENSQQELIVNKKKKKKKNKKKKKKNPRTILRK